jgi:hypothetical protein
VAQFHLQMTCDNAAFGDEPGAEVARILIELFFEQDTGILHDENGNAVGTWDWEG